MVTQLTSRLESSIQIRGGGVAILIRTGIPHSAISGLDESLEIIGITIELKEVSFDFFSFYSSPTQVIPYDFFSSLEIKKTDFVLVDDLNSKTESIGCKGNDQSGKILEKILTDTSITIHNDTTPTYYQHQGKKRIRMESEQNIPQYTEILDLVLSSSSLNNKITSFEVLTEHDMTSDHCPVTFNFKISVDHVHN